MARTRRIKAEGEAFYHVASRITGKHFLLKSPRIKKLMLNALERAARFSGVNLGSFCIMDDHFHLLLHIPSFDVGTLPDSVLLERIEILCGKKRADRLHDRWEAQVSHGETFLVEEEKNRWRRRMYDLSEFIKTFKEEFRRAFQREYDYSGRLWGDRFFSTLIGSSAYLMRCAAYIEMNPVRAGMVTQASQYEWSTSGQTVRGDEFARACREWLLSFAGVGDSSLQGAWLRKRWPQISKGKILGDVDFVAQTVEKNKNKLFSRTLRPRMVTEGMFASHGYRLVARQNKAKKTA